MHSVCIVSIHERLCPGRGTDPGMGIYGDYLDQGPSLDLNAERKKQLGRIAQLRDRDVLVYAADSNKAPQAPVGLDYSDFLPITDQLSNLNGKAIDIILETGGGRGEAAE